MSRNILHIPLWLMANHHDAKPMPLRKWPHCSLGKCQLTSAELTSTPWTNTTIELWEFMAEIWKLGVLLKLDSWKSPSSKKRFVSDVVLPFHTHQHPVGLSQCMRRVREVKRLEIWFGGSREAACTSYLSLSSCMFCFTGSAREQRGTRREGGLQLSIFFLF